MSVDPLYVASGAAVGLIVGLTGVGGGSLMTPVLVLLFGVHPAIAVGTDLLYAAITKSAGSIVHGLGRNVAWRVVGLLATGSVPVAAATLLLLSWLGPESPLSSKVIPVALGVALLLTAALVIFRTRLQKWRGFDSSPDGRTEAALTVLTGAALGFLVPISSVGAGAIGVTVLLLLYPKYPLVRIVGTDIAHAVPLTLVSGLGHLMMGSVDLFMLASLLLGSIPGITIGSHLARHFPERGLRLLLALILVVAGLKLVFT